MSDQPEKTRQLVDDIVRGVDDLARAVAKLPTKADWRDALIKGSVLGIALGLGASWLLIWIFL